MNLRINNKKNKHGAKRQIDTEDSNDEFIEMYHKSTSPLSPMSLDTQAAEHVPVNTRGHRRLASNALPDKDDDKNVGSKKVKKEEDQIQCEVCKSNGIEKWCSSNRGLNIHLAWHKKQ